MICGRNRSDSARRPRPSRDSPSFSWHEPTFKGPFKDGLPQHDAASEAGLHRGFNLIEYGDAAIDYFENSMNFRLRWYWKFKRQHFR